MSTEELRVRAMKGVRQSARYYNIIQSVSFIMLSILAVYLIFKLSRSNKSLSMVIDSLLIPSHRNQLIHFSSSFSRTFIVPPSLPAFLVTVIVCSLVGESKRKELLVVPRATR